eukprot:2488230-Ditylum_brightwellii.AAC.1
MANSLVLSSKTKVGLGTKMSESGIRARTAKRGFRQPMFCREKFEGKTPELGGFVYNVGYALQADMYVQTTKEIAQYASQTCKQADNIKRAIKKLQETVIPKPMLATASDKIKDAEGKVDPAIANIYLMKEIDMYLKR